jgi:hypothetical protein
MPDAAQEAGKLGFACAVMPGAAADLRSALRLDGLTRLAELVRSSRAGGGA